MAGNLLPLLLIGGAAVVVTRRKKRKAARACPREVRVSMGEVQSAQQRALSKHGQEKSPEQESFFLIREILPAECSVDDSDTRIKIMVGEAEFMNLPAPDIYMMYFGRRLDDRLKAGAITEDEANVYWASALDWYKKVTGKNFDATKIAENLMKNAGEQMKKLIAQFIGADGGQ